VPAEPDLRRAEALLSEVFGALTIEAAERCAPWFVSRLRLRGQSTAPPSVIVKWLRESPVGFRTDPTQLLNEWAALEFLGDLGLGVAPRLVVADAEVLVMEDLAPRVPLFDLLARDDPGAVDGLRAFASTMGHLHAATTAESELYHERRRRLGPTDPAEAVRHIDGIWDWQLPEVEIVGMGASHAAEAEMAVVRDTLTRPGPFLTFTNGDSGANNFLVTGGEGRIIDFEFAGYRHALIDAACLYMPGSMWMTVAHPAPSGADSLYRTALCAAVPQAEDDLIYGHGLAAACMARTMEKLLRLPKLDARPPGHHSRAQIISTIDSAVRVAEAQRALPHLTTWAHTLADTLRQRWPDADRDFPEAYTTREPLSG